MSFVAVGDNCVDFYVLDNKAYAGGCSLNFSIYMNELGCESSYLGAVGEDEFGTMIQKALNEHGVDSSHLHILQGKTAVTTVKLAGSERTFIGYEEGVLKEFRPSNQDLEFISQFDYIHTSVYGRMEDYLDEIRGKVKICYDFADKFTESRFSEILDKVDFAFFPAKRKMIR